MNLQDAIAGAKKAAKESQLPIAVVHDTITNNTEEEPEGPYGYCPEMAVSILFRWGTIIQIVQNNESLEDMRSSKIECRLEEESEKFKAWQNNP